MMLYKPEELVVTGVATPVARLVAVTVAPSTTEPWESVMVPPIFARPDCAHVLCVPRMTRKAAMIKTPLEAKRSH